MACVPVCCTRGSDDRFDLGWRLLGHPEDHVEDRIDDGQETGPDQVGRVMLLLVGTEEEAAGGGLLVKVATLQQAVEQQLAPADTILPE